MIQNGDNEYLNFRSGDDQELRFFNVKYQKKFQTLLCMRQWVATMFFRNLIKNNEIENPKGA